MTQEVRFEVDGKEYYITPVTAKIVAESQRVYNKAFRDAVSSGALLKKSLEAYMKDQGLWDDKREEEYKNLVKTMADLEYRLKKGKIKVSEGRELALQLKKTRNQLQSLVSDRNYQDSVTAEGQADTERFNYLVYASIYDFETRKPVYQSLDEYRSKTSDELTVKLATKFASHYYGVEDNYEDTLTENKFLKRYNMIDGEGYLLSKEGQRVDSEGHLLDAEGYRIDTEGHRIDINNNPVIETDVTEAEFEDDYFAESAEKPKKKK